MRNACERLFFLVDYIGAAAAIPSKAKTKTIKITPMKDMTSPAIDNPLGDLNTPIKEKTTPRTHRIQPKMGIHPRNKATKAMINPAVPMPLDFFCS